MTVTASQILTAETVPAYLLERIDTLKEGAPNLFTTAGGGGFEIDKDDIVTATAITGGNVNYAFCVTWTPKTTTTTENDDDDNKNSMTIFVKQAPEFVAIFGPDGFPLTSERMQQEMDVYNEWKILLGDTLAQRYLPQIYFFDKSNMVVVMEFLDGHTLLDHVLVDSTLSTMDSAIATGLGDFMGKTHAATHSSILSSSSSNEQKKMKDYITKFENRAMRDIQLEFVFTKCYKEATDEQRCGLTVTTEFLQEIEVLKQQYNGQYKYNDNNSVESLVLCHGDLHPGSVMVNPSTGSVKVIDPEFTIYGPPGLDVGSLLSGYCLGAIHQAYSSYDNPNSNSVTAVNSIIQACYDIWESYISAMKLGGITNEAILRTIEVETVGFTVAEVCRTAMEFAGGRKWLQFENEKVKAASKKAALQLVDKCMIARHEGGMTLLLEQLKIITNNVSTTMDS